jgi:putative DNA primase/helicase
MQYIAQRDFARNSRIRDDLVERARTVPIEHEIERRRIDLRGRVERCGSCPRCGGRDRFSINVKKQIWNCRGCAVGGDVITLVQHLDCADFTTAVQILAGGRPAPMSAPSSVAAYRTEEEEDYEDEQHRKAAWLWQQRRPLTGSSAERYLREVRGIHCPLPATLAYLAPTRSKHHPALIAAYGDASELEPGVLAEPRNVDAVHLVLLKPDGSGKADSTPNKITVGSPAGQPIILAPLNDLLGLAITEGIEDALSVHTASGLGAWAAGGASHMPKLAGAVPDYTDWFRIVADGNETGYRNAFELYSSLIDRGLQGDVIDLSPLGFSDAA